MARWQRRYSYETGPEFEHLWGEAVDTLESSINILRDPREFGAISSRFLPYVSILPVFCRRSGFSQEACLPSQDQVLVLGQRVHKSIFGIG